MDATGLKMRRVPDVPQDVDTDSIDEHFNDPNWDASSYNKSDVESMEMHHDKSYYGSETEIDRSSIASSTRERASRVAFRVQDDLDDDSPYPEVRAAVSNIDDPSMPVNTFRVWLIGCIVALVLPGLNQFFSLRFPTVYITALVVQLISLPIGMGLARVLPTTRFNTFGYIWSFNPGPFNIKEHTVILVIANVTAGGAYATEVILTQRMFYGQNWGFGYNFLLTMSTQIFGFALAGFTRKFLVWPASMLWPSALVNAALFSTLHRAWGKPDDRHISRQRFFFYCFIGAFVWYWFPGYIFTALSVFNWVCWIAPNNIVVNQLFGYNTGLGMGFLTFDWAMISWIGSPLVTPWWAQINVFACVVFFFWIVTPVLYYSGIWYSKFMPIIANAAFDNTGNIYDPTVIVDNGVFNQTAYEAYSPVFLPTAYALAYGIGFAALSALVTHTWLWYRRDIVRLFRTNLSDHKDVHARLMLSYKEVPGWWYAVVGVVTFTMGVACIEAYPTGLPVWAYLLSLVIAVAYVIPAGMIAAITNQVLALNVLSEFIIGYTLPGKPVAMMIFKTYCFFSVAQSNGFAQDLKLGHYMKVPPRVMFWAQILGSIVAVLSQLGVQAWQISNIPDLCHPDQKDHFVCPGTTSFYTASLLWGAVGPQRLFSAGQIYGNLMWFFLVGFLAPIPAYYAARRWPRSFFRYINFPIIFNTANAIPPATGINFSSWFMVGFIFQYFLRRKHFRWWLRYNYILSAAMDAGVGIALVIIFFTVQFPKGGFFINWWGNTVWQNTLDAQGAPFTVLAPGETFGPKTWS